MVVTKAPSEPFSVLKKTLEAMLSQKYPHDTWVADEDPQPETISWCKTHGVKISTRKGIPWYHRLSWPRRTRCKEGNLAYFYDMYGYEKYDFVVQMDIDHVPSKGYLEEMIRPFADEKVGYVAAPSICDANFSDSWVVRARLYAESSLHGALQVGYNSGWAPLCIGSHYAVRTIALKDIGGLGSELAEDHTTSLMMNSRGWKGVFALEAEAHGDGAKNFADSMIQEYQWSRSLMKVLLGTTKKYWRGLTPKLKFQFLFAQLWYPTFAMTMLLGNLLAALALVRGEPWMKVDYFQFLIMIAIPDIFCLTIMYWLRYRGWLRPKKSSIVSWETVLFQLARWPWVLIACTEATISALRGKEINFRVTPKGSLRQGAIPWKISLPYLLLVVVNVSIASWVSDDFVGGYTFLALSSALGYLVLLITVNLRHILDVSRLGEKLIFGEWRGQVAVLTITIFLMAIGVNYKGKGAVLALVGRNDELMKFVAMRSLNTSNGVVLSSTDEIQPGKISPTYHKVKPGDNLWDMAESYYGDGTKWILIGEANVSANKNSLKVGQELVIPSL